MQQEHSAGCTPNETTLSLVGSLPLRALHSKKDILKGMYLCHVQVFILFLVFFCLINSQAEEQVNFPFSFGFKIASSSTPSWYWNWVFRIWGTRRRGAKALTILYPLPIIDKLFHLDVTWYSLLIDIVYQRSTSEPVIPQEVTLTIFLLPLNMFFSITLVVHQMLQDKRLTSVPFLGHWVHSLAVPSSKELTP